MPRGSLSAPSAPFSLPYDDLFSPHVHPLPRPNSDPRINRVPPDADTLPSIPSSLNRDAWEFFLRDYPDRIFVQSILHIIDHGANISFTGNRLVSQTSRNLPSAFEHPDAISSGPKFDTVPEGCRNGPEDAPEFSLVVFNIKKDFHPFFEPRNQFDNRLCRYDNRRSFRNAAAHGASSEDHGTRQQTRSRGWENTRTATLNCSLRHEPTEETFALLREGDIDVLGTELPYFLYREGHVYDPEDTEDGLLEGQALFAVAKHVYQGPSACSRPQGKAGNEAVNGVTSLTGPDVAYVTCQLRFALSQQSWNNMDGIFSYPDFYWTVVDILRGEERQEILQHLPFGETKMKFD
ncbi:hypothetical protein C8R44DRAFT_846238 [Mycena epipterygia]|nr:hypothetical protein C8R44DRAFT_846238 [Mycena epipterygia]